MSLELFRSLGQAARSLRTHPGSTAIAVLSLGLGIGITTTAFTLLNSLILRELPGITAKDELVTLALAVPDPHGRAFAGFFSFPDVQIASASAAGFDGLAAAGPVVVALRNDGRADAVVAELATSDYFRVLGTRPLVGRFFTETDADVPVAVLAHRTWVERFDGDDRILGRTVSLSGVAFTVIGVAPEGFAGMVPPSVVDDRSGEPALWAPVGTARLLPPSGVEGEFAWDLDARWLRAVARIAPGRDRAAAEASASVIAQALAVAHPVERSGATVLVGDVIFGPGTGEHRATLTIIGFLVVPVLVLLIACANAANLLLVRGTARSRELAVRLAIGAHRRHLFGQLILESLVMGGAAALVGLVVAYWSRDIAAAFGVNLVARAPLDLHVLAFTVASSILTGLLFGVLPAIRATRIAPAAVLGASAAGGTRATSHLRGGLVVAQMTFSFVLLVTCGLFVRSARAGMQVDTGLEERRLLVVTTDLDLLGYAEVDGRALYARFVDELRSLPAIEAAGTAATGPLQGFRQARVSQDADVEHGRTFALEYVGDGYFEAIGAPLRAGRPFTAADATAPVRSAVVNRAAAEALWPDGDALGRTLRVGEDGEPLLVEIVGIAGDTRARLGEVPQPIIYLPLGATYAARQVVYVRTVDDPAVALPAVRAVLRRLDPDLPLTSTETLPDIRRRELLPWRLTAMGMGALGGVALLLAAVGLYGVVAHSVTLRTRELGVRMAIGATAPRLLRDVVYGSMALVLLGVLIGALLAGGLALLIRGALFGVAPLDPVSFGGIATLLLAVAALAALGPARRAAAADPMIAIRSS